MLIIPENSTHTRTFLLKLIQRPSTLRLISCDLLVLYIFFFPGDANHVLHLQAFIVSHRVTQRPHRGPFPISMLKLFRSDRERPHRATPRTAPPPRDQTLPSSDQVIRLLSSVHLRGAGVVIRRLDVTSKKGPRGKRGFVHRSRAVQTGGIKMKLAC